MSIPKLQRAEEIPDNIFYLSSCDGIDYRFGCPYCSRDANETQIFFDLKNYKEYLKEHNYFVKVATLDNDNGNYTDRLIWLKSIESYLDISHLEAAKYISSPNDMLRMVVGKWYILFDIDSENFTFENLLIWFPTQYLFVISAILKSKVSHQAREKIKGFYNRLSDGDKLFIKLN